VPSRDPGEYTKTVDKSFEVYLSLYQAVTGTEDVDNVYRQFSEDFFDLVIVDECHRGSADENSAWRGILEYFDSTTGTATATRPAFLTGSPTTAGSGSGSTTSNASTPRT
jgi:type I restriction enzyme R subunit